MSIINLDSLIRLLVMKGLPDMCYTHVFPCSGLMLGTLKVAQHLASAMLGPSTEHLAGSGA